MASYHLSVKIIKRSNGRSSVAAAAYRARTLLHDERQGLTFDYSRKTDLAHSEIIAPENAPKFVHDRGALWNAIEHVEKRKDAQLAREVEVALPAEFSLEKQIQLTREFAMQNFVSQGMVADINLHGSETNPHAHILLTMREVNEKGFGKKVRAWNKRDNVLAWREEWAALQNRYLAREGLDIRVEHRSFDALGIELTPQNKLGVGKHSRRKATYVRVADYHKILRENGECIIADPTIALQHLTYHHATFTKTDVFKYLNSHSDDTRQFERCRQAVFDSPELIVVGKDKKGELRYSTRTMVATEKAMLHSATVLSMWEHHGVDNPLLGQTVTTRQMTSGQLCAFYHMTSGRNIAVMTGKAGSGKSYTLGAVKEAYEAQGYRVQGAALAGIAAEALERSSGITSQTIHKTLWLWEQGRGQLNGKSVLVVDEAAMVGTRQMAEIVCEVERSRAKLILVGDDRQLQSIEAGAAFRGICERVGQVSLTEIKRQRKDWQKEATQLLSGGPEDIAHALKLYREHGNIRSVKDFEDTHQAVCTDWAWAYGQGTSLMLAHRKKDVFLLNRTGRMHLKDRGHIAKSGKTIKTAGGKIELCKNERVMFLRNEKSLNVKNGSLGTVEKVQGKVLQVKLDTGERVAVDTRFYQDMDYGYAATVHKSQGTTVDRVYVLATRGFDRHLSYVALSRHREDVKVYHSRDKEGFSDQRHMERLFARVNEKTLVADYGELRGLGPAPAAKACEAEKRCFEIVVTHRYPDGAKEFIKAVEVDPGLGQKERKGILRKEARRFSQELGEVRGGRIEIKVRPVRRIPKVVGKRRGLGLGM